MVDQNQDDIIDINSIMELLPHRYPFLLIDRVLEVVKKEKVVAIKNVTMNEPHFTGHFPDYPVMPGVLITEAMAQTSGILALKSTDDDDIKDYYCYLATLNNIKFRRKVIPGDQLVITAKLNIMRSNLCKTTVEARVSGELAASGEIGLFIDKNKQK